MIRQAVCMIGAVILAGCGGGGSSELNSLAQIPSAPQSVVANAGDTTMSVAWQAPASPGGKNGRKLTPPQ